MILTKSVSVCNAVLQSYIFISQFKKCLRLVGLHHQNSCNAAPVQQHTITKRGIGLPHECELIITSLVLHITHLGLLVAMIGWSSVIYQTAAMPGPRMVVGGGRSAKSF